MTQDITRLLGALEQGDRGAHEQLFPLVYEELRRLAGKYMRGERAGHTLQATALVHEAYLKLSGSEAKVQNRTHFFALAAQIMRRLLVDHARGKQRDKRGGDQVQVTLDDAAFLAVGSEDSVLELDEALTRFSAFDERAAKAVELNFFVGLTQDEIATALGVSKTTVYEDLRLAKAWLAKELGGGVAR